MLAEALWTGRGPFSIIARRAGGLYAELRSFVALQRGLERRFVGYRFDVKSEGFAVRGGAPTTSASASTPPTTPPKATVLDYRHLAAAQRHSGVSVDAWLQRARLEDLVLEGADLGVLVRSPTYLKAYPDALAEPAEEGKSVLVAVRLADGSATVVHRAHGDDVRRFDHFRDEATRQLPVLRLRGARVCRRARHQTRRRARGLHRRRQSGERRVSPELGEGLARAAQSPRKRRCACRPTRRTRRALRRRTRPKLLTEPEEARGAARGRLVCRRQRRAGRRARHRAARRRPRPLRFHVGARGLLQRARSGVDAHRPRPRPHRLLARPELRTPGRADLAKNAFERAVRQSSSDGEMDPALGRTLSSLASTNARSRFSRRPRVRCPSTQRR